MSFLARGFPQTTNGEDATHEFAGSLGNDESGAARVSDGYACGDRDLSGGAAGRMRKIPARERQRRTEPRRRFLQPVEY